MLIPQKVTLVTRTILKKELKSTMRERVPKVREEEPGKLFLKENLKTNLLL